jgi:hypothetical protein
VDYSVQHWYSKLDELQQHMQVPWWKLKYAKGLLARIDDFLQMGMQQEATVLISRLQLWMARHQATPNTQVVAKQSVYVAEESFTHAGAEAFEKGVLQMHRQFKRYKQLIPRPERIVMQSDLDVLQQSVRGLEERDVSELMHSLQSLRARFIQRLRRSLRAVRSQPGTVEQQEFSLETPNKEKIMMNTPVGPYNNHKNFFQTLSVVGDRDPIWVEDFMQCYHHLIQLHKKIIG